MKIQAAGLIPVSTDDLRARFRRDVPVQGGGRDRLREDIPRKGDFSIGNLPVEGLKLYRPDYRSISKVPPQPIANPNAPDVPGEIKKQPPQRVSLPPSAEPPPFGGPEAEGVLGAGEKAEGRLSVKA